MTCARITLDSIIISWISAIFFYYIGLRCLTPRSTTCFRWRRHGCLRRSRRWCRLPSRATWTSTLSTTWKGSTAPSSLYGGLTMKSSPLPGSLLFIRRFTLIPCVIAGNDVEQTCKYLQTNACNELIIKISEPSLSNVTAHFLHFYWEQRAPQKRCWILLLNLSKFTTKILVFLTKNVF